MKSPLRTVFRLGAALALLTAAARADDEDSTTARIKFSDAAKPGTLKAGLPWADVHVTGTDGHEIIVTSTLGEKGKPENRSDGLRRLDEEVSFELTEKDNVATLQIVGDNPWSARGSEFNIQMPRNTRLILRTDAGGDAVVENVDGDIDITSMNGAVTLRDIGSSAVVNTMNGEISASFKAAPQKPVSFSSMNGEIFVRLPGDTKANIRLRSHNGSILTDFPDSVLKTRNEKAPDQGYTHASDEVAPPTPEAERDGREAQHEATRAARDAQRAARDALREAKRALAPAEARAPNAPRPPPTPMALIFGGKSVIGTLNGGGVDIQLATMNGTITLRQTK